MEEDIYFFQHRLIHKLQINNISIKWCYRPGKYMIFAFRFFDISSRIIVFALFISSFWHYIIFPILLEWSIIYIYIKYICYKNNKIDTMLLFKSVLINHGLYRSDLIHWKLVIIKYFLHQFMMLFIYIFGDNAYGKYSYFDGLLIWSVIINAFMLCLYPFFLKSINGFLQKNYKLFFIDYSQNQSNNYILYEWLYSNMYCLKQLIETEKWMELYQFIVYGVNITPNVLLEEYPDLLQIIPSDLINGEELLRWLLNGTTMDKKQCNDLFISTLQIYEEIDVLKDAKPFKMIQMLIETQIKSLDINSKTVNKQRTFLHIICDKKHLEGMDIICNNLNLYNSINPNISDCNEESAFHILLSSAFQEEQISITQKLLMMNDININMQSKKNNNETILHYAIKNYNIQLFKLLIDDKNIDLFIETSKGENYLHFVAKHNDDKQDDVIGLMLIDKLKQYNNFDINALDKTDKNSALYLGINKPNFIKKLLQFNINKVSINISNENGNTALHLAAKYINNNESLHILLEVDELNINAIDKNGNTALHKTICLRKQKMEKEKQFEHINLLLKHPKIDPNIFNVDGLTALHFAYINHGYLENIKIVLNNDTININQKDLKDGNTALHYAMNIECWEKNRKYQLLQYEKLNAKQLKRKRYYNLVNTNHMDDNKKKLIVLLEHKEIDLTIKNKKGYTVKKMAEIQYENIQKILDQDTKRFKGAEKRYNESYETFKKLDDGLKKRKIPRALNEYSRKRHKTEADKRRPIMEKAKTKMMTSQQNINDSELILSIFKQYEK